jgi:hypothetical protein
MLVGLTPVSGDVNFAVAQAAGRVPAAGVVVPLRPPPLLALLLDLPLLHAPATSMSDTAIANQRKRIVYLPPELMTGEA